MLRLSGHDGRVWRSEFSPDDRFIVTSAWDNTMRLWSAEEGQLLAVLGQK